jgi:hypothetical protein
MAEATARGIGRLTLADALELTILIAVKDPRRHSRAATRWLRLYLGERPNANLEDVALAFGAVAALGGGNHDHAALTLRAMAEKASTGMRRGRVA